MKEKKIMKENMCGRGRRRKKCKRWGENMWGRGSKMEKKKEMDPDLMGLRMEGGYIKGNN